MVANILIRSSLTTGISETLGGVVDIPEPYCHAGGSSPEDLICVVPKGASNVIVAMEKA